MKSARMLKRVFPALVLFAVLAATAQEAPVLSIETMNDPQLFRAFRMPRTWWLDNGTALVYDSRKPAAESGLELLDPETGKRTMQAGAAQVIESFNSQFEPGGAPRFFPAPLDIDGTGRYALFLVQADIYLLDLKNISFIRITQTPKQEKSARFSPDGKKVAFVRENDLYVYCIDTKKELRLTADGTETILNGTLSWVYWEELFGRQDIGYWWSEDSKAVAFFRTDESPVSIQHIVNFEPWTPTVYKQRYPKVGEPNPVVTVGIAELETQKTTWADLKEYEYVVRVNWMPGSKQVCVRTMNRMQTEISLFFVDRKTGASRHILTETDSAWVNVTDDLYFLENSSCFIMASERSGYNHLYRFTMDGTLVNQITGGDWAIRASGGAYWLRQAVQAIDEENGCIYVTAQKKSPLEKHLYRVNMDGSGLKRLSSGRGTHAISMSPDARFYFDRYSNISTAPSYSLHSVDGTTVKVLAEPDPAGFEKYNCRFAEIIHIPARDGFPLHASITKPADFDSSKTYPVVLYVYGGPSAPQVSDAFQYGAVWENVLLNEGYICMKIDNRAASAISKNLENLLLYSTPGETELNDLVDAVQYMKQKPWIDNERWGIYGWSGGGTNTVLAMCRSQEFKAGIAGGTMMDYRFYDTIWGETMMKTEDVNKEAFEKCSLLNYADGLHGRLMLVHGSHDNNVHIQQVWRFVDKLIDAGKLFELMVYPNRGHGVGDPAGRRHYYNLMLDFWQRNL